jgi:hypothetical protein
VEALIALGCKGPHAMEEIEAAERLGWISYGIAVAFTALVAAWIWIRRKQRPSAALLVGLAHPGLWWSARAGDCGRSMKLMVFAGSLLVVLAALYALYRARPR